VQQHQGFKRSVEGKIQFVDEDAGELEFYRFVFAGQHFEVVSRTSDGAGIQCLETERLDFVLVSQDKVNRQRCVLQVAPAR
jgi:hypothetical protein